MNCTICGLPTGNIVGSVLPQCKCGWQAPHTSPPPRQPLTDWEIDELSRTMVKGNKSVNWLARAIEAVVWEKQK